MDRHVIVVSIVGGTRLDLSQVQLAAPEVILTKVSLVGGVRVWVPAGIRVEVSGFSLIGGTRLYGGPEPGPGAPTVHIRAFGLVGGTRIYRSGSPQGPAADRYSGRRPRRGRLTRFWSAVGAETWLRDCHSEALPRCAPLRHRRDTR